MNGAAVGILKEPVSFYQKITCKKVRGSLSDWESILYGHRNCISLQTKFELFQRIFSSFTPYRVFFDVLIKMFGI